jgi:membrane-associated phospholipid phosphatase
VNPDRRPPWLALGCLTGYLLLTVLVLAGVVVDRLDVAVRDAALRHSDATLVDASEWITDLLSPGTDAALLGLGATWLSVRRRSSEPFVLAALTGWLAAILVLAFKAGVGRGAPGTGDLSGRSYPSGHTAMTLVCLGALVLLAARDRPRLRRPLLVAVAVVTGLVAAGLVYANFHWMTDTVASALLGTALLSLLHRWLNRRTASPRSPAGTPPNARSAPPR